LLPARLNIKVIEEAERSLKNLALKQGVLKHSLDQVKHTLKDMVSRFIDRLGELSESTGDYHDKIAGYSEQISRTDDITELEPAAYRSDARNEADSVQRAVVTRQPGCRRREVEAAQRYKSGSWTARWLTSALKLWRDQLTGALNRRGLDDGFEPRGIARRPPRAAAMHGRCSMSTISSRLNDKYGHQAGDDALVYLPGHQGHGAAG